MNEIFVSYASEDRSRVQPLVAALQSSGWSVFWDRTIPTGRSWRDFIGKALVEAQAVVVVWTEKSVNSEWVLEEAESGKRRRCLIPVLLDPVEPPLGFGSIQAAHLVAWTGDPMAAAYRSLAADIAAVIGSPRGNRAQAAAASPPAAPIRAIGTAPLDRRWLGAAAIAAVLVLGLAMAWMGPWLRSPAASVAQPSAQTSVASLKPEPAKPAPAKPESTKPEPTKPEPAKPQLTLPKLTAVPGAATPASAAAATGSALGRALQAMASGCDQLVFDADRGTLNGLSPAASQEVVKMWLPCSTGETPDGAGYNYGGGVFFIKHDFFFYTGRDFIELRRNFSGRETRPLLGLNKPEVKAQLGSKLTEIGGMGETWLFEKSYGCLRLDFGYPQGVERVTQIGAYLQPCDRNQALRH